MLSIQEITEYNDFLKMKDIWDRLIIQSEIDNPYLSFDWFRIAIEYFEKNEKLFILLVKDEKKVIAIAPFLISIEKEHGIPIKKLRFLENVHTPIQDFILTQKKREALEAIIDHLLGHVRLWDLMELREIRRGSENLEILKDLCKKKNVYFYQFLQARSWCAPTNASWEEGLAKIAPKTRKEFRRKIRRIEKLGRLSIQAITETDKIVEHLSIFFEFHEQTWKGKEKNAEFYYRIAREFSKKGKYVVYCLYLDDRPIAYMFGIKFKNTLYGLKTTYDPTFYAFSPGIILFYKILESTFIDKDIKKFDIGRGEERFKREMASYPINQMNIIGGHKKTFYSYFYFIRLKVASYVNGKKSLVQILTVLKNFKKKIKNIKEQIREKKIHIVKKSQLFVFYKNLNLVKSESETNELLCKIADLDDIDHLAVATKAKNLTNLKERLENENCYLIVKDGTIQNYFWLTQNNAGDGVLNIKNDQIILYDFNPLDFKLHDGLLVKMFNKIFRELVKQKYIGLFVYARLTDHRKIELLESLDFQKYKIITTTDICNHRLHTITTNVT